MSAANRTNITSTGTETDLYTPRFNSSVNPTVNIFEMLLFVAYIPVISIGMTGNALILTTLAYKQFRTISNCFVVVLCIADMNVIVEVGFVAVVQIAMQTYLTETTSVWCLVISNTSTISIAASFLCTELICVHRFVRLALNNVSYFRLFGNKTKVCAWCLLPFGVAAALGVHTDARYESDVHSCLNLHFVRNVLYIVVYLQVYVTVIILYVYTFKKLSQVNTRVAQSSSIKKKQLQKKSRILRTSVLVSGINAHLYFPYLLTSAIASFLAPPSHSSSSSSFAPQPAQPQQPARAQQPRHEPPSLGAFEVCLSLSRLVVVLCCSANSVVYGVLNTTLRDYLLRKLLCRKPPPGEEAPDAYSPGGTSMTSMMSVRLSSLKERRVRSGAVAGATGAAAAASARGRKVAVPVGASLNTGDGLKPHRVRPAKRARTPPPPLQEEAIDAVHPEHPKFAIDPVEGPECHVPIPPRLISGDTLTLQSGLSSRTASFDSLVQQRISGCAPPPPGHLLGDDILSHPRASSFVDDYPAMPHSSSSSAAGPSVHQSDSSLLSLDVWSMAPILAVAVEAESASRGCSVVDAQISAELSELPPERSTRLEKEVGVCVQPDTSKDDSDTKMTRLRKPTSLSSVNTGTLFSESKVKSAKSQWLALPQAVRRVLRAKTDDK